MVSLWASSAASWPALVHAHSRPSNLPPSWKSARTHQGCAAASGPGSSHSASALPWSFRSRPVLRPRRGAIPSLAASAVPAAAVYPAADPWTTLAVLSICAAASQLLEAHTHWGALLSAPLLALMAALAAAALGFLPPVSPIYDVVWRYLMPLAVALYLLDHDVTSLVRSGGQVLVAFLLGAGSMLVGAWVSWQCVGGTMGPHGPQLASCLLASYIGGSVNFAAVAAASALPPALMPAAMAADNLAMLLLLAAMMTAPVRLISSLHLAPTAAAAAGPGSAAGTAAAGTAPRSSSSSSGAALGLDGQSLMTQPPSAAAVAACVDASARGRDPAAEQPRSGSSSRLPQQGRMSGSSGPKQHVRSKAVGQLGMDGGPLLTPDPQATPLGGNGNGSKHGATKLNNKAAAAAAAASGGSSSGSKECGGCRASGVTALDENPLLTRAPAMGDAISTINAAREGRQQLVTPAPPGSTRDTAGSSSSSNDDGVVGCGCCSEALDRMAAASSSRAPPGIAAAVAAAAASPATPSGALALDGGLLMTEEPDSTRSMAAAVAAAKRASKSGSVSVSSSALSTLASTDADELELVVKFNFKDLQESLRKQQQDLEEQQQREQQQQREASKTAAAAVAGAAMADSASASSSSNSSDVVCDFVSPSSSVLTSSSAAAALAAAVAACAASQQLAAALAAPALQLLLLSGCALGLSVAGSAAHKLLFAQQQQQQQRTAPPVSSNTPAAAAAAVGQPFAGSSQLGQLLMGLFFATLGASCCCSWSSLAAAAPLLSFVVLMVGVHWVLMAGLGGLVLKLPGDVLLAGSAANIGGPATAAGLAAGKGWGRLVQPSLLCGSLGYALGTAGGLLLARCLGALP